MFNLKKHYCDSEMGLSELLPYALLIGPGAILNKDGSFLAAWQFRGRDTASSTAEELSFVAAQVNQALLKFGNGWVLHVDAVRRVATSYPEPERSHFPDRISKMIDEERRSFFAGRTCFETAAILSVTYTPTHSRTAKALGSDQSLEAALGEFNKKIDRLEADLSTVLTMFRLNEYQAEDELGQSHNYSVLLSHLQDCLTGDFHPVKVPAEAHMYLDSLLGSKDLTAGLEPKLGGRFLSVISIDGFPQESYPAILDYLNGLPFPYRLNTRYLMLGQQEAIKEVENYRKGWNQQIYRFIDQYLDNPNARPNRDAAFMTEDADQAKTEAQDGLLSFGFLTSTAILMHENLAELNRRTEDLVTAFGIKGFSARVETYNALQAWQGSLPSNARANVRRPLMSTRNLSHLLPLSSVWPGLAHCPCDFYPPESPPLLVCTTDGSTPFRLNLHEGDIGHTLIIGPTGSGKSTLLALIAAQFRRYPKSQIFAFDKGLSLFPICRAVGGRHYAIGLDDLAFAPLSRIGDSDSELAWAGDWVSRLMELRGLTVLPGQQNAINTALRRLAGNPDDLRSLTDFYDVIQDDELKEALKHYTNQGSMGRLLDAVTDNLNLSDFLVFEIEELMNLGERNTIPVLLYLFHRLEKALKGQPSMIILDEAWIMLGHKVFKERMREWFKVMRKNNCAIVMATQNISDAVNSGILDVITESCKTKILLPNEQAGDEIQFELYQKSLGLNRREISMIAEAVPKADYYITSPSGRRKVQLALGPKTLAFVGHSSKDDIALLKKMITEHGDEFWPDFWLKHWLE